MATATNSIALRRFVDRRQRQQIVKPSDTVLTDGNGNNGSILSQSGMGSNAVVDGNGYIVYLNHEDSTDFHSPAIPFVPPDNNLTNTGKTLTDKTHTTQVKIFF